jgi:hypothetical protein
MLWNFKKKVSKKPLSHAQIPKYRNYMVTIFIIFFVIALPLIFILASGNSPNFDLSGTYNKTTSIKFDVSPAFSDFYINSNKLSSFTDEIRVPSGKEMEIKISKDGFIEDKISIFGPKDINSYFTISPFSLLPQKNLGTALQNETNKDRVYLTLLSNKYILFKDTKDSKRVFIAEYTVNTITNEQELFGISSDEVAKGFINVGELSYFFKEHQKLLTVNKDSNKFEIIDLEKFNLEIEKMVKYKDDNFYFVNKTGILYKYDQKLKIKTYIDDNVKNIEKIVGENFVYILKDNPNNVTVYSINTQQEIVPELLTPDKAIFQTVREVEPLESPSKLVKLIPKLEVYQFYNGTMFLIGTNVFYKSNSSNVIKVIAKDVLALKVFDKKVITLSIDGNITMFDLYNPYIYKVSTLNSEQLKNILESFDRDENIKLTYVFDWSRVMIYTKTNTYSVFFNNDYIYNQANSVKVQTSVVNWQNNKYCHPEIISASQFCITENGKLEIYKNSRLLSF